jgi:hypothetical protein
LDNAKQYVLGCPAMCSLARALRLIVSPEYTQYSAFLREGIMHKEWDSSELDAKAFSERL